MMVVRLKGGLSDDEAGALAQTINRVGSRPATSNPPGNPSENL